MEIDVVKTFETIGHSSYIKVMLQAEIRYDSTLTSGYRLFDARMAKTDEGVYVMTKDVINFALVIF